MSKNFLYGLFSGLTNSNPSANAIITNTLAGAGNLSNSQLAQAQVAGQQNAVLWGNSSGINITGNGTYQVNGTPYISGGSLFGSPHPTYMNLVEREKFVAAQQNQLEAFKKESEVLSGLSEKTKDLVDLCSKLFYNNKIEDLEALDRYVKNMEFSTKLEDTINE